MPSADPVSSKIMCAGFACAFYGSPLFEPAAQAAGMTLEEMTVAYKKGGP